MRRLALVNVLLPRVREVLGWLGQLLAAALEQPLGGRALVLRRTRQGLGLVHDVGLGCVADEQTDSEKCTSD